LAHNSDDTVNTEVEDRLQTLFFGGAGKSPGTVKDSAEPVPTSPIEEMKEPLKDQGDHGPDEDSPLKEEMKEPLKDQRDHGPNEDSPLREGMKEPLKDQGDHGPDEDSPLRELGAIVLSVDWEINDEIMNHFIEKVADLKSIYKEDRNSLFFLQLLDSVGKYIKTNKVEAHPDSINVLNSVYSGLSKTVLTKGMTEPEKKKILLSQVTKFKRLKEQVASTKGGPAKKRDAPMPGSDKPPTGEMKSATGPQKKIAPEGSDNMSGMLPHEAFVFALEEIREVIKSEFKALRAELKLWREGSSS